DLTLLGEDHIRAYRDTDGAVGHLWNGAPTLLLTVRGRRTGEPRTVALIYGTDGDDHLVVASMGGAPVHPQWYRNLVAEPRGETRARGAPRRAGARPAPPAERPRLWAIMRAVWPNYDAYQGRTDRDIPVVVLSRVTDG